jgi:hypothetical protein
MDHKFQKLTQGPGYGIQVKISYVPSTVLGEEEKKQGSSCTHFCNCVWQITLFNIGRLMAHFKYM